MADTVAAVLPIEARDLTKTFRVFRRREGLWGGVRDLFQRRYRPLHAVDGLTFRVAPGESVGLIGPNGAGKSTTVKMLTGILVPTRGHLQVGPFVPHRDRVRYVRHIGAVFGQRTQLWWDLAVLESFRLLGKIYGVPRRSFAARLEQLDAILGLGRLLHTPVRKLSLGERMRCDLAASLLHGPAVLFLDEPTIGLDLVAKDAVRAFLKRINRELGTTLFLTTHDLRDIEELCPRVLLIDRGRLLFDGPLGDIKRTYAAETRLVVDFREPPDGLEQLAGPEVAWERLGPRRYRATFDRRRVSAAELARKLLGSRAVADLAIPEPDIESVVKRIYREGLGRPEPPG